MCLAGLTHAMTSNQLIALASFLEKNTLSCHRETVKAPFTAIHGGKYITFTDALQSPDNMDLAAS